MIQDDLIRDEGLRLKPYICPAGKLTIGVGRNLDDKGITKAEALLLLDHDINEVVMALHRKLPWFDYLGLARQDVLVNMAFNMGVTALLKFKKMLAAVEAGDYHRAADEMLASKWAGQVGRRATRLAVVMREGQ